MKTEKKWMKEYNFWVTNKNVDPEVLKELVHLKDDEIEGRFNSSLEFGTAGIRGLLGAGTNRLNVHTVSQFAKGLALKLLNEDKPEVVIGYDVRHCSESFAHLIAGILSSNNIKVHLFEDIAPTPLVSYAIRNLSATCGIMITASHNPKEYNGCKVYWSDGAQITSELAKDIVECISNVNLLEAYDNTNRDLIVPVKSKVINNYMDSVSGLSLRNEEKIINVVYTPLNGCGNKYIEEMLKHKGYKVHLVKEQVEPDPNFSTTPSPNPEDLSVFEYAKKLGSKENAELLIATDPDADRVGIMVFNKGQYEQVNGNMLGALMLNYILSSLKSKDMLSEKLKSVTTIATSDLGRKIASSYGIETIETHVGFKNIYSLLNQWNNNENEFLFGYEESYGYGIGSKIARDKDAISASMLIAEMTNHYRLKGKSLIEVYEDLQVEHGYHCEETISVQVEGLKGKREIESIVRFFREYELFLDKYESFKIDYLNDNTGLEKMNVIEAIYANGTRYIVRPSGTEPKLKIYIYSASKNKKEAFANLNMLKDEIYEILSGFSLNK